MIYKSILVLALGMFTLTITTGTSYSTPHHGLTPPEYNIQKKSNKSKKTKRTKHVIINANENYQMYDDSTHHGFLMNAHNRSNATELRSSKSKSKSTKPASTYASRTVTVSDIGRTRPSGCPHAWCGCWLARKIFGTDIRDLWLARNWLKFPRTTATPGAIAVLSRGRNTRSGHVGIVISVDSMGNPTLQSGNHNRVVGIGTYSKNRVLAYVMPR